MQQDKSSQQEFTNPIHLEPYKTIKRRTIKGILIGSAIIIAIPIIIFTVLVVVTAMVL